jgi:hypothetical protein
MIKLKLFMKFQIHSEKTKKEMAKCLGLCPYLYPLSCRNRGLKLPTTGLPTGL